MRQISRLLARSKLPIFQQVTLAKTLEYVKSLTRQNGPRRRSHLRIEIPEKHCYKLRAKLVQSVAELQNNNVQRDILRCGMAPALRLNDDSLQRLKNKFIASKHFYDTNLTLNENENFYNIVNRRRVDISEAIQMKKEIVDEILKNTKGRFKQGIMLRKTFLKETIERRRNSLRETEQKVRDHGKSLLIDIREAREVVKGRMEEVIEKENIYTIPNLLCVARIAFSPYLAYLIITNNFEYALTFMAVASFSDWLDGWIARNYQSQSSKIGSFLDPMADKVLIGTLFLTLTYVDLIPVPLTVLIVGRDVALVIAGFVIRYKSLPSPRTLATYFDATHVTAQLAPTLISKINTGVQLVFVASTLAAPVLGYVGHPALDFLCYVTAASTILAAGSYIISKDTYRYIQRK